jgi:hypothetical protein
MQSSISSEADARPARPSRLASGWSTFASIYLALAGTIGVIYGVAALANRDFFNDSGLLWSNLSAWGWVSIVLGGLEILIALEIYRRTMAGAIGGMAIAVLAFIANFLAIGAYPIWSVIAMVMNGFVIWALPRAIDN